MDFSKKGSREIADEEDDEYLEHDLTQEIRARDGIN